MEILCGLPKGFGSELDVRGNCVRVWTGIRQEIEVRGMFSYCNIHDPDSECIIVFLEVSSFPAIHTPFAVYFAALLVCQILHLFKQ